MYDRTVRRWLVAGAVVTAAAALTLFNPLDASAETTTVTPTAITTTAGSTGSGQSVAELAAMDLSGTTDNWNKYVEFSGRYSGYLTFTVPNGASWSAIAVQVNYRGPATATQKWTFSLYNWSTSAWVPVGTNVGAPDWGAWKLLTFNASGTVANYVSSSNAIRLQLSANNSADAADIDYAAVVLTSGGGVSNTVAPSAPASTVAPSAPADTVAPSAPAGLRVTASTVSSVSLSWSGSTDNVGVTGYEVLENGGSTAVASPTGTSATISGLSSSTRYSFAVRARDAVGNRSAASAGVSVTTGSSGGGSGGGGLPAPVACPGCWRPALQTSWNWVISEVPAAPYRAVQMYDIDGFDATAADVASLHAAGKKVVCYLSVGTDENWRPDAAQFPAAILGKPVDGWSGERWLDVRDVQQPGSVLAQIMSARLDMCRMKGFDAVEFDNMDGYANSTGFPLTAPQQGYYDAFLANGARSRGMSAVMKNDIDQITTLLPYMDMALNEQCNQYQECGGYSQFIQAGKPVFNAEYATSTSFCAADNAANINGVNFSINLDDSIFQPCR